MRSAAKQDPARQREVTVGEFLVDGARVPLSLVDSLQHLTRTEAAALRFAGWGRSNADIATLLAISEGTARTHLNSAVRKLELDGMRGLVALAGLLFHPLD
ncbi:MAG: helix-turn-helix transcriptional regulator [Pseudomonadota bacterium]